MPGHSKVYIWNVFGLKSQHVTRGYTLSVYCTTLISTNTLFLKPSKHSGAHIKRGLDKLEIVKLYFICKILCTAILRFIKNKPHIYMKDTITGHCLFGDKYDNYTLQLFIFLQSYLTGTLKRNFQRQRPNFKLLRSPEINFEVSIPGPLSILVGPF